MSKKTITKEIPARKETVNIIQCDICYEELTGFELNSLLHGSNYDAHVDCIGKVAIKYIDNKTKPVDESLKQIEDALHGLVGDDPSAQGSIDYCMFLINQQTAKSAKQQIKEDK